LTAAWAEAAIGTIWLSSPWMISVGTFSFLQSKTPLKPACMPWSQNESRSPCETFDPGRLAP